MQAVLILLPINESKHTNLIVKIYWPSIEKDEKGTLKATELDKYENIADSVWLSLFMGSNENAYYCPRRLASGWAQLNIYTR
jgi:hypothetical protein